MTTLAGVASLPAMPPQSSPAVPAFSFCYRLTGAAPSIRRFRRSDVPEIEAGGFVTLEANTAMPAASGDTAFLGVALPARVGEEVLLEVISDEDAVYAVNDPAARATGDLLDLAGPGSTQSVTEGQNEDFEVVVDCTAAEATLLRIKPRKHAESSVAVLSEARERPLLTPARERELVLAAAAGDQASRAELIEVYLPAISGVARRYRSTLNVERSELLQEGVVGMLRAIERFDPTVGTPFWAYAAWWVRQAMQQLVSEVARPTVLSDRGQRALALVREVRGEYVQAHRREPSVDELATASELTREQVERVLAVERTPRVLSEPLNLDDETSGTLGEQIPDPVSEDEYEQIIEHLLTEQLGALADVLDDRERAILYDHYGVGRPPQTFRAIGARLSLSAEGVRQIEVRALEKLRLAAS